MQYAPGWTAKFRISSTVWMSLSGGACRTMMREPKRHSAQPTRPRCPSCSFSKKDARMALGGPISLSIGWTHAGMTYPMITLKAPSGVINIGGAKVYATKLRTDGGYEIGTTGLVCLRSRTLPKDHWNAVSIRILGATSSTGRTY